MVCKHDNESLSQTRLEVKQCVFANGGHPARQTGLASSVVADWPHSTAD